MVGWLSGWLLAGNAFWLIALANLHSLERVVCHGGSATIPASTAPACTVSLTLVNRLVYAPAAVLCCFSALALITACRTLEDGELEGNDMVMLTHSEVSLPLCLCGFNVLINELKELVLS